MDQVEIDKIHLEFAETAIQRSFGIAVIAVPQLGGEINLVAGDAAVADRFADALFIAVKCRRVDMPVAGVQRRAHCRLAALPRADQPHTQTEARHMMTVIELNFRIDGKFHVPFVYALAAVKTSCMIAAA